LIIRILQNETSPQERGLFLLTETADELSFFEDTYQSIIVRLEKHTKLKVKPLKDINGNSKKAKTERYTEGS
jgi:hypothetical protein